MTGDWPWPAPVPDGRADHLGAGLVIPHVALPATAGGKITLARLRGRTVLFVYPWTGRPGLPNPAGWDDIPGAHGSTPEAEGFRDHYEAFRALGWQVIGMSAQRPDEQSEFSGRLSLPFMLLSDHAHELARALRLPTFETGGTTYLRRLTLLINDGVVERTFYPVHPPDRHAHDLLGELPRA